MITREPSTFGLPGSFETPRVFLDRMDLVKSWSDLRGKPREDKPWIPSAFPRIVFLNDMGDTFTEDLFINWLRPCVPDLEALPFVFILLSKRVRRMESFFSTLGRVPDNFVLGTSITNKAGLVRVRGLLKIEAGTRILSAEPLIEPVDLAPYLKDGNIDMVIVGGESGERPFQDAWARAIRDDCHKYGVKFFMKQKGGPGGNRRERMTDFPEDLRIREFPDFTKLVKEDQPSLF